MGYIFLSKYLTKYPRSVNLIHFSLMAYHAFHKRKRVKREGLVIFQRLKYFQKMYKRFQHLTSQINRYSIIMILKCVFPFEPLIRFVSCTIWQVWVIISYKFKVFINIWIFNFKLSNVLKIIFKLFTLVPTTEAIKISVKMLMFIWIPKII